MNTATSSNARFTLTAVSDVDSLPFAPKLRAAVRAAFQGIWDVTPHRVGVSRLRRILGDSLHYKGHGVTALYTMNIKPGEELSLIQVIMRDVSLGVFRVVEDFFFRYVPVQWVLSVREEGLTLTPELEHLSFVGEFPFWEFMRKIDSGLMARGIPMAIATLDDHPKYKYALATEAKCVMRELILALAAKYDLKSEIILPAGYVAVDTDDMRELLEQVGYDADYFDIDEELILASAAATLGMSSEFVPAQRALLEHAGYDPDEFEVEEELILRVAKATKEAEDRFHGRRA